MPQFSWKEALYMELLIMMIAFGAIMYFIIIRPQQQQLKKHEEMIEGLAKGDKIVTNGGLIAEVKKVEEKFFSVKLGDNDTTFKLVKDAVARKYEDEA
jgi:preprotein translocase subunit YajC